MTRANAPFFGLLLLLISCCIIQRASAQSVASATNPPYPLVPPVYTSLDVSLAGTTQVQTGGTLATQAIIRYKLASDGVISYYFYFQVSDAGSGYTSARQDWIYRNGTYGQTFSVVDTAACTFADGTIINYCTNWTATRNVAVSTYTTTQYTQTCTYPSSSTVTTLYVDQADGTTVRRATQQSDTSGTPLFADVFPTSQPTTPPTITVPLSCQIAYNNSLTPTTSTTPTPTPSGNNNTNSVPVNCVYTWNDWSTCTAVCGGGTTSRVAVVTLAAANGGTPCPAPENATCNTGLCTKDPLDCIWTWGQWTDCSAQCATGVQYRSPVITQASANGGIACPTPDSRSCTGSCSIDCAYTWSAWSTCTAACGGGSQSRYAVVTQQAFNGTACPGPQTQACNTGACTTANVNCAFTWGAWSNCSVSCGNGSMYRVPVITTPASGTGTPCPTTETATCTTGVSCVTPVNCAYTWNSWTGCSATCGGGERYRTPTITTAAANGGNPCPGTETETCNTGLCTTTSQNCVYNWTDYSSCSVSCGDGTQTRTLVVSIPASGTGTPCPTTTTDSRACNAGTCNSDCQFTWTAWSNCTAVCGGGFQYRSAIITAYPTGNGLACPSTDSQACNTGACTTSPQNCNFTWGPWSDCSVSCGTGYQYRSPIITQSAANGGTPCPTTQNTTCTNPACPPPIVPQNCVFTWGQWGACDAACGGGVQYRQPIITTPAANGGNACPTSDSQACNTGDCTAAVQNCNYTWSSYSTCSASCGNGTQTRSPIISQPAANGGTACPASETQTCNLGACTSATPVNCVYTWGQWTNCSVECGGGIQYRSPVITTQSANGGTACPTIQSQPCNTGACVVVSQDCVFTWLTWSACSASCGTGTQTRTANVTTPAALGGNACPADQSRSCVPALAACPVPVDCVYTYSAWTQCSVECGGGTSSRYPVILTPASNGGQACPTAQSQACNTGACVTAVVNCSYTWSPWTACAGTCGTGSQERYPIVTTQESNGGQPCPALQSQSCPLSPCDVDCNYTWGAYSPCSAQCGGGLQTRSPIIYSTPIGNGNVCPQPETVACNTGLCPTNSQNCFAQWSEWTPCSVSCGNGVITRSLTVVSPAVGTGTPCTGPYAQNQTCNAGPCNVNCVYTWSPYGQCSAECGGGVQYRSPVITVQAAGSGTVCPTDDSQPCNTGACTVANVSCAFTWGSWSNCSAGCGQGTQTRVPIITTPAANGGTPCPQPETTNCSGPACLVVVNCEYQWGQWGPCTKECGGGSQTRVPIVTADPQNGGTACPLPETRACNTGVCTNATVNCAYTWNPWSSCSASCGDGNTTRTPTITQPAANGGTPCPTAEIALCNLGPCTVNTPATDCVFTWGAWSNCTSQCGGGTRVRTATITIPAANGGMACPDPETEACNTGACVTTSQDCAYVWSTWTDCSASCGNSTQTRYPYVTTAAAGTGAACPPVETRTCTVPACDTPINCAYTWDTWTACSAACGGGTQSRIAIITVAPNYLGTACPATENRACNTGACTTTPQDCLYTWSQWSDCTGTCGTGLSQRTPTIFQPAANGGAACPTIQNMSCTLAPCNAPCQSTWTEWSQCSVGCGGTGTQSREPVITSPQIGSGTPCPTSQTKSCTQPACPANPSNPVNCAYTWSQWSNCTATCGPSTRTRYPIVTTAASNGGTSCPSSETETCNTPPSCGTDCVYTWSSYTACSEPCNGGTQSRVPVITVAPNYAGIQCPDPESIACNTGPCVTNNQNCVYGWTEWSPCSATCGTGTSVRLLNVTTPAANNGTACPTTTVDTQNCSTTPCDAPRDCDYTWTEWTTCSKQCGGGVSSRIPIITTGAVSTGAPCPSIQNQTCNDGVCTNVPLDCIYTTPRYFGACSVSCDTGVQYKQIDITRGSALGGLPCPTPTIIPRACYRGTCGIGAMPLMTCWTGNTTNWWFYGGYNNPTSTTKQLAYGSLFNQIRLSTGSPYIEPSSVTSTSSFPSGFYPYTVRVRNTPSATTTYNLDSNKITGNASVVAYRCPGSVLLIRPLQMDCLSPINQVEPLILEQLVNVSRDTIGFRYSSPKLFQNITLTIERSTCPPSNGYVPAMAYVTISDPLPTDIAYDTYPLHAYDLAWELRTHTAVFNTFRLTATNTQVPATSNDKEAWIELDGYAEFGVPGPLPPPPSTGATTDSSGSISTPSGPEGLDLMWWVVIIFISLLFILCCLIVTLYLLGTKEPNK